MAFLKRASSIILLSFVLISCGGESSKNNDNENGANGKDTDNVAPSFTGIAFIVSASPDEASVTWNPATDNVTSENNMHYELHYSSNNSFAPDSTTLYETYIGKVSSSVVGLIENTEYFFKMVAVDEAGNRQVTEEARSVTTSDSSAIRTNTDFSEADALNLGAATVDSTDESIYRYSMTSASTLPEVGSVIIGQDVDGNPYFRIIEEVNQIGNTLELVTSDAVLNDLLESASISTEVVLRSSQGGSGASVSASSTSRKSIINQKTYNAKKVQWKNQLLTITETDNKLANSSTFIAANSKPDSSVAINASASNALSLTGEVDFKPSVKTNVELTGLRVSAANVTVSGPLSMILILEYDYEGQINVKDRLEVFNRSYLSYYLVGTVPVWQETTLSLEAVFTGNASTALHAESDAGISGKVSVNATYNGSEWTASTDKDFYKELTVSASAHGSATAEVRIIPTIHVRFYSVAASAISVEPFTNASVEAQAVVEKDLTDNGYMEEYGFTRFDAFAGVDVNVMADLSIFEKIIARYPGSGTENIYNESVQLFGLPTLRATYEEISAGQYNFEGSAEPFISSTGLKNRFDESSAHWAFFPQGQTVDGMSVTRNGDFPESVYFIGNSEMLGEIGKQYVKIEEQFCDIGPDSIRCYYDEEKTRTSVWETQTSDSISIAWRENTEKNHLIFSYSFDPFSDREFIATVLWDENEMVVKEGVLTNFYSSITTQTYHSDGITRKSQITTSCNDLEVSSVNNFYYERYYDEAGNYILDDSGSSFHNERRYLKPSECPTYEEIDNLVDYDRNDSILYQEYLDSLG